MRINHNISALNTYRQLNANGVSTQKSLEKLSSGLRINRAGDDAAGLAISEKMRGQIRGLDQAKRNAQDAISLIQTAEGALNETHSILQRMKELATQAANDTNTTTDRDQIQKEINQLTSEINRIGNTTEFNTKSLLNGALNVRDAVAANVKGGAIAGNIDIIDTSTNATAVGDALTSTNTEISADGRPTVTGTRAYANPSAADSGPNVGKTSATATSSMLDGSSVEISALGDAILIGDEIFSEDGEFGNVQKTAASVTGGVLSGTIEFTEAYQQVMGTKDHSIGTELNVGAGNNELQFTIGGRTATIAVNPETYTDVTEFIEALQTAFHDADGGDDWAEGITVRLTDGKIDIRNSSAEEFTINGGGLLTSHILNNPDEDSFATQTIEANTDLTLTVNGNTETITLTPDTYDLSNSGDRTSLINTLNSLLGAKFGGNIEASFDEDNKQLVLTNIQRGEDSTITDIGGSAAAILRLDNVDDAQGMDTTSLYVTYNGTQKLLSLTEKDYDSTEGNKVSDFIADLQSQLDAALGSNAVTVGLNTSGNIEFKTSAASDTFTVDAGGAKALIGTSFTAGHVGEGNNELTLTVGTETKTITLTNRTYNFTNVDSINDLIGDLNAQLKAEFGDGVAEASWDDTNKKLVLTNLTKGAASTISDISGSAAEALGLDGTKASYAQGTDNTALIVTFNGNQETITLAENDYSSGGDDGADGFKNDLQAKLDAAFGAGNIEVSFDADNKLVFMTKNASDTFTIDGGSAEALLKSDPEDDYQTSTYGVGNNTLNLTVNGVKKSITLSNGSYDFTNSTSKTNFLDHLNGELDASFGVGNVVASFDESNRLVFTNTAQGSHSTIVDITGTATNSLGLASISYSQGKDANNTGTLTIDDKPVDITLNAGTYNPEELASELQAQIRAADESLANATVSFVDGSFIITSGTSGQDGSIIIGTDELAKALKLTASEGVVNTAGAEAVDQGLRFQVGANAGQSITLGIQDMRSRALGISNDGTGTVTASDGKVAYYTAESSVTNETDNVYIEYALDITSNEKASAAISVLDDSINSVSSQRSSLGAYQNRLEHTINNLDASAENLTAAESRIRDVDMAKEMMEFTKNSILSQAAQAMLAQANQQPQGVLQLLR
ncbi:MAG: flagellin [Acetivibrionales bacterium]|jgi:flagellin